jgi:hypothetical protein
VTSKTRRSTLRTKHAPLARLLAFVLLALVTYAATAEAAHKHGNLTLDRSSNAAPAFGPNGDDGSSLKDSRTFGDCLICQLHQHLSVSLFSSLPQVVAPPTQIAQTPAAEFSYLSQSDTPRRGRAPPLSSLF